MRAWAYFASSAKADERTTVALLLESGFLCRPARNTTGQAIANVRAVRPGDIVLLFYDRTAVALLRIAPPDQPIGRDYPALTLVGDPDLEEVLERWEYRRDPVLGAFTGFTVEVAQCGSSAEPLWGLRGVRAPSQNALHPLHAVGGPELVAAVERGQAMEATALADAFLGLPLRPPAASHGRGVSTIEVAEAGIRVPSKVQRLLGIDVGFSSRHESLGYLVLDLEPGGDRVQARIPEGGFGTVRNARVTSLHGFLSDTLPRLLDLVEFDGAALDGPLTAHDRATPRTPGAYSYRPCEQVFLGGSIPNAIRPGGFLQPVGSQLHGATMAIRDVLVRSGMRYQPYEPLPALPSRTIVESFPKAFLGVLRPVAEGESRWFRDRGLARAARDPHMARECFLARGGELPAPRRRLLDAGIDLDNTGLDAALADRDVAAAFVSALGAALYVLGLGSMLGDAMWGSFLLPAARLWEDGWRECIGQAMAQVPDRGYGRAGFLDGV